MRRKGFVYSVGSTQGEEVDYRTASNPLRASTIPLGYHLPPQPAVVGRTVEMTLEMELALDGGDVPPPASDDGVETSLAAGADVPCTQDSTIKELEDVANPVLAGWVALARSLDEAQQRYGDTPEAANLNAQWSDCMKQRGYTYADPAAPRSEFADAPEVTSREVQTRSADYECDVTVGLTTARSAWQRARYEQWRSDNAASLAELSTMVADYSEKIAEAESAPL